MLIKKALVGVAAAVAFNAGTALAQTEAGSHELQIYSGEFFGDKLTDARVSGRTPELDDDVSYGIRYGYNFTNAWGIEASLGRAATSVTGVPGADIDLDLTTLDVNGVYHLNYGTRFVPYVTAGVGYASADLDRPIVGLVNGRAVAIDDDEGFTANAGIGAKYFVSDSFLLRLEAKYRYLDAVVDRNEDSLNTFETTLGFGWRF